MADLKESIHEDIAYLTFSVRLADQPILEAEKFIAALERRVHEGFDRPILFICHSSDDKPFVESLVAELDRRALHAWFDKREILVGDSIVEKVNAGLRDARYIVVVLSPQSVTKPWVLRELNSSLMRQLAQENVTLLPVLLESCEVPPLLRDLKYADFRVSFDKGFSALLESIRQRESISS